MAQMRALSLAEISGDLTIYFNWSANALVPFRNGAADVYLKQNHFTILKIAQKLLKQVDYTPAPIYRGIILRHPVKSVLPHERLQYLSFSTDRSVAEHFADVMGFGSKILDVKAQLGEYGYIIEYTPKTSEILFHYHFLSILPYAEAFSLLGMDGPSEVMSLNRQKEIMILQPTEPFTNISLITDPTVRSR